MKRGRKTHLIAFSAIVAGLLLSSCANPLHFNGRRWAIYPNEPEPTIEELDVFDTVLEETDKYFYRLGNENEISFSYLFTQAESFSGLIDSRYVDIQFNAYEEDTDVALESMDQDMDDWTNTTFKLIGTGLIQVTLTYTLTPTSDEYEFAPYEIYFEVENGCNVTDISQLNSRTSGSDILLCNLYTDTYKTVSFSGDSGLYGNGFEVYCDATSPYDSGFIELSDTATMDHIRIICKDHEDVYAFNSGSNPMFNSAVETRNGDVTITNSFIQGGRSALRSRSETLVLSNTILYGGAYANLLVSQTATITLDNFTSAQYVTCDGKGVMGFGVLIEDSADETAIILQNEIKQYNWVTEEEAEKYFNYSYESYTGSFIELFESLKDVEDSLDELNTGILAISCNSITLETSEVTNKVVYAELESIGDAYVTYLSGFTVDGHKSQDFYHDFDPDEASITDYGVVKPTFNMNIKSYEDPDGSGSYLYYNESTGMVTITLTKDDTDGFTWVPEPTATKNGIDLLISIIMDGTEDISKGVTFLTTHEQDHYVTYSYTDPYNYQHNEDGSVTDYSIDYNHVLHIMVVIETDQTAHAVFEYQSGVDGTQYPTKVVTIDHKNYVTIDTDTYTGYSEDDNVKEWQITDSTGNVETLYVPHVEATEVTYWMKLESTVLLNSLYWYYPLFSTISITDYVGGLSDGEQICFDSSTTSNVDEYKDPTQDLFSMGDDTRFDVLTPSDDYWSGPYDGSHVTFTAHTIDSTSYLCIKSNERSCTSSYTEKEWVGEFSYTDEAGQIYYYGIDYTRPYFEKKS